MYEREISMSKWNGNGRMTGTQRMIKERTKMENGKCNPIFSYLL